MHSGTVERVAFAPAAARFLFYCLVVWAPLPLGSNRPIFWVVNGVLATAILTLFLIGELTQRTHAHVDWRPAAWILFALVVVVAWMIIQTLPGMSTLLQHSVWQTFSGDLPDLPMTISLNASATWTTILQVAPVFFLAVVAMRIAFNHRRARFLVNLVIATTVGVAVYGLLAQYFEFRQVFLLETIAYEGSLTGTFVSRNAVATYFAMGLAGAASMIVAPIEDRRARSAGRRRPPVDMTDALRAASPYLVAFLVLTVAILNTGSRGGLAAAIVALVAVAILSSFGGALSGRAVFGILAALVAAFLAVFAISGEVVVDRLLAGTWDDGRIDVYQDTLDMIATRPLLGQGAGTFVDAYPAFHNRGPIEALWNRAHNSYLQGMAELGLPALALLLAAAGGLLVYLLHGLRRRSGSSPAAVTAVAATVAVAVHSLIDFSIQFQAVGLTLAVLLGAGLGEISSRARPRVAGAAADPDLPVIRRESVKVLEGGTVAPKSSDARVPDGLRAYVFGDVHGRMDLLTELKDAIDRDRTQHPAEQSVVIGLGDYIDRGSESNAVIEALSSGFFEGQTVFLRGNHEQMLIDFLEDPEKRGSGWFHIGGADTVRSYCGDIPRSLGGKGESYRDLRNRIAAKIPPSHLLFIQSLPASYELGGYFFAHAGARPGTLLHSQETRDLLWIRDGFADRDATFEKVVVHGHTPVDQPYFGLFRINIDTGAYFTNRLTCLVLEGATRRILESHPG